MTCRTCAFWDGNGTCQRITEDPDGEAGNGAWIEYGYNVDVGVKLKTQPDFECTLYVVGSF